MSAGTTYFTYTRRPAGNFMPWPVSTSARNSSHPQPRFDVQNVSMINAPKGNRLLDKMKSSSDWMSPMPGTAKPDHTL